MAKITYNIELAKQGRGAGGTGPLPPIPTPHPQPLHPSLREEIDSIVHLLASTDWQQEKCQLLALTIVSQHATTSNLKFTILCFSIFSFGSIMNVSLLQYGDKLP